MTASPYRGVYRNKNKANPWEARIWVDGIWRRIGSYPTPQEAAAARRAARQDLGLPRRRNRWISATAVYEDERDWFEIELSQNKWALVDLADADLVIGYCWNLSNGYAIRKESGNHKIRMHREILGLSDDDPREVDHRNGDPLDNRRANLRIATRSQNRANARKQAGSSSRFKGVYWHKEKKKWMAEIHIDGKKVHLGSFIVEEDGARAYVSAALEAFGEFARYEVPA